MPKNSARLRAADYRHLYLLVGQCCELGADPLLWRRHMLTRLSELLGATGSVDIEASFDPARPGVGAKPDVAMSLGDFSSRERALLTHCLQSMPMEANPLGTHLAEHCPPGRVMAAVRSDRVAARHWQRCQFKTDYFDPLGWDDSLCAIVKRDDGFRFFNFSRQRSDSNFSLRAARMLELFVDEITRIPVVRLAPMSGGSLLDLPPRQREVLLALAEGDSEKQIAARLGVARSTVHEYVRRLFARYNVSSRSELLLRAARQVHALQLGSTIALQDCWLYQSAS